MASLWLRVRAPFAAYRPMQAGVYRTTAPTMTPSAAHGLVLNLAAIDVRDPKPALATGMRQDAPKLRIAIGAVRDGEVSTLYQQLHGYPVGSSGKELKDRTHGAKYWIAPVRREILVGLDLVIGIEAEDEAILGRVRRGLDGTLDEPRYGLPFAGDNNLLFDDIAVLEQPSAARWYVPIGPDDGARRGSARMTVGIDRADASRTTSALFAPLGAASEAPPTNAWTWVPRAPIE